MTDQTTAMMRHVILLGYLLMTTMVTISQQKIYCSPINLDYGYSPIPNFSEWRYTGMIIFSKNKNT
jgi:uncharacterized membrane protein